MGVIITMGHISDSSKDISDCLLAKGIPALTMVTEEGVAENKEQKKEKLQDLYANRWTSFTCYTWQYVLHVLYYVHSTDKNMNVSCSFYILISTPTNKEHYFSSYSMKVSDPWRGRFYIMICTYPFLTENLTGKSEPHYIWRSTTLQCHQ